MNQEISISFDAPYLTMQQFARKTVQDEASKASITLITTTEAIIIGGELNKVNLTAQEKRRFFRSSRPAYHRISVAKHHKNTT